MQLRKAGMIVFVIGVILFFGAKYVVSLPFYLGSLIYPRSQSALVAILGTLLTLQIGSIVLLIAGAAMFILGRRQENTS